MKETAGGVTDHFLGQLVMAPLARHKFSPVICNLKVETNYPLVISHKRYLGLTKPLS